MNRQRAQSRKEAQHAAAVTAFVIDQGKTPCAPLSYHGNQTVSTNLYTGNRNLTCTDWSSSRDSVTVWSAAGLIEANQTVEVWKHSDTLPHVCWPAISTPPRYVLNSQVVSVMIYYWMVNCQIAGLWVDAVRARREWTLYSELSASSQRNSKRAKVTVCELQWSHLSCCSIPAWAPRDHSHLDQWRRSPRSCQSTCRPHKMTRRWLEKAERGRKSVIPPRIGLVQTVSCRLTHLTAQHLYLSTLLAVDFLTTHCSGYLLQPACWVPVPLITGATFCTAQAGLHVFRVNTQN